MRLRERDKRDVIVYAFTGMDEDVYTWGRGRCIRAAVYPAGCSVDKRVYGEGVKEERLMLYDGDEPLCAGMGVSLDGGTPAYRIVSIERWSHVRAVLERIPEGRRNDAD